MDGIHSETKAISHGGHANNYDAVAAAAAEGIAFTYTIPLIVTMCCHNMFVSHILLCLSLSGKIKCGRVRHVCLVGWAGR